MEYYEYHNRFRSKYPDEDLAFIKIIATLHKSIDDGWRTTIYMHEYELISYMSRLSLEDQLEIHEKLISLSSSNIFSIGTYNIFENKYREGKSNVIIKLLEHDIEQLTLYHLKSIRDCNLYLNELGMTLSGFYGADIQLKAIHKIREIIDATSNPERYYKNIDLMNTLYFLNDPKLLTNLILACNRITNKVIDDVLLSPGERCHVLECILETLESNKNKLYKDKILISSFMYIYNDTVDIDTSSKTRFARQLLEKNPSAEYWYLSDSDLSYHIFRSIVSDTETSDILFRNNTIATIIISNMIDKRAITFGELMDLVNRYNYKLSKNSMEMAIKNLDGVKSKNISEFLNNKLRDAAKTIIKGTGLNVLVSDFNINIDIKLNDEDTTDLLLELKRYKDDNF